MHGMHLRYGGVQATLGRADEFYLRKLQLIKSAIKTHAKVVSLLGREITVNCTVVIFMNMIPAKKGYGGRVKLPGNLKAISEGDNLRFALPATMSPPERNLPLGGGSRCKASNRFMDCAAVLLSVRGP